MDNKDTVITVGVTREDEYGNLWVTPQGGDKEIKIAAKREALHPLFEQGKAVLCHWETYKNIPYVSDAKWVEGELPPPREPYKGQNTRFERGEYPDGDFDGRTEAEIDKPEIKHTVSGVEIGRCWNAIDTLYVNDKLQVLFGKENAIAILKYYRGVLQSTLKLPVDGAKLPQWDKTKEA